MCDVQAILLVALLHNSMDTTMAKNILFATCLLTVTGVVSAHGRGMICPELDPSSLMSGLSLLAAGLVVWRGRKGKRSDSN